MKATHFIRLLLLVAMFPSVCPLAAAADDDDVIGADRPGLAEGAAVVGAGRFQVETGLQKEFFRLGGDTAQVVSIPTLLRLGINEQWELRVESDVRAWERVTDATGITTKSQGDAPVSIGAKYRFQEDDRPDMGLIVRVAPRSGSGNFRSQATTGDVRLVADWALAPRWSLNPNIGYARAEDDAGLTYSSAVFAATLEYKVSDKWAVSLDGEVQAAESKNGGSASTVDAGVTYLLTRDTQLDFTLGGKSSGTTPPRLFVGAGVSVRF